MDQTNTRAFCLSSSDRHSLDFGNVVKTRGIFLRLILGVKPIDFDSVSQRIAAPIKPFQNIQLQFVVV